MAACCAARAKICPPSRHALKADGAAAIVEVGYLNYSAPTFEDAFEKCVTRGADEITVMPYFLIAGKFVQVDLPPKIEAMRARFPQVRVLDGAGDDKS